MNKYTVGIDVGGTNVKLGLIDARGRIVARSRLVTKSFGRNKAKLITALCGEIKELISQKKLTKKRVAGIGFGLPGLIDPKKGVVKFLPNIPGWKNVPLKSLVQKQLRIPTFLENDVNLITLGEWKYGAGKGYKNLLCMTLGTGVGGGLILNNELYRGEGYAAGEVGHMPLNETGPACNCGGFGCFERYVGNKVLSKKASKIFKIKNMNPPDVTVLAKQGNARAFQFWEETGTHIGNALVGVINLLNVRLIIIGGGVSNNFSYMSPTIRKVIRRRAMKVQASMVKIVRSKFIDDAGLIGAQVLVKEGLGAR